MSEQQEIGLLETMGEQAAMPAKPKGTGWKIEALDKEWLVSSCELRIKALFEKFVREQAISNINKIEDANIQDNLMSRYLERLSAGAYNWEAEDAYDECGSAIRASLKEAKGLVYLFYLLLKRNHPEITVALAKRIMKAAKENSVSLAIQWALGNSSAPVDQTTTRTTGAPSEETFDAD